MARFSFTSMMVLISALIVGLSACNKDDELASGPAIVGVSLPAEMTTEDGWAVLAVDVLQGTTLTTIYPDAPTTSVEVQVQSGSNVGVVVTAAQTQSQSLTWYRGTRELVPEAGSQPLEVSVDALPTKEVSVLPSLRDEQAALDIEYLRDFAIIFADLETGFVTNPLFKTRDAISLPEGVSLFAFFLSIDVHGEDLGIFQMDTNMLGIDHHDGLVTIDHHDGLVAIDHHDGLEVDELSIDHHDGMTLNELGIDHHDGLTTAVLSWKAFSSQLPAGEVPVSMGVAPTLPTPDAGSTEPATASEVEPGEVILQDLEGFPQMDTAYAIECAESVTCDSGAVFQSCADSVVVAEDTTYQIRYEALVDLGCVEFRVMVESQQSSDTSCASGTSCDQAGYCSCSDECSAQACGASPECGSCGTCEGGHCALDENGFATCVDDCMFNGGAEMVGPLGTCVMGRFIYVCQAGVLEQYQCLIEDSDYQCLTNGNTVPVCGDPTCSPSCADLRVGQTDGCGNVCGTGVNGEGLPCSDAFFGVCHPDGPPVTCESGSYVFDDGEE